jgi:hypothetical protein
MFLTDDFELWNLTVEVYGSNPFVTGVKRPKDNNLKLTICRLHVSADDSSSLKMLNKLGVNIKSGIKYEKLRYPVIRRMKSVLNGSQFLYISPLENNRSFERHVHVKCTGIKCRIYQTLSDVFHTVCQIVLYTPILTSDCSVYLICK